MKILVINSGSSSLKYQLIDIENEKVLAKGLCERIGLDSSFLKHNKTDAEPVVIDIDMHNHKVAIKEVLRILTDSKMGVISDISEILAVGHRVVHGGEKFKDSVLITDDVLHAIKDCIDLAPLHNPPNIVGIQACKHMMPSTPMVAVFDTAFHQTMPEVAYLYALPYEMYEKYGIRKFGFHGTSHKYVSERAAKILNQPIENLKIVSCHLGNGASVCAIDGGKSVETSMGFTPLDGLAMGTRSGAIDPAIIFHLMDKLKMTSCEVNDCLNKHSGVLGISGISSDFRDIEHAAECNNKRAQLALDIFSYKVKKYIGKYIAVMGGIDAVIFTAGIGENNGIMRRDILSNMEFLGIKMDPAKDSVRGKEEIISTNDSKVSVLVIPTNEELAIARETARLVI